MALSKNIRDGLAILVAKNTPLMSEFSLFEGENFDNFDKLIERCINGEPGYGLNPSDWNSLLIDALLNAINRAREQAQADVSKDTSEALRQIAIDELDSVLASTPTPCYVYVPLELFPEVPEDGYQLAKDLALVRQRK